MESFVSIVDCVYFASKDRLRYHSMAFLATTWVHFVVGVKIYI
jgi:hypothetical protein